MYYIGNSFILLSKSLLVNFYEQQTKEQNMAATLPNVVLPANTWVDIYAATGIAVGTKIIVENLGSAPVDLVSAATAPLTPVADGFSRCYTGKLNEKVNEESDPGAFAISHNVNGLINVKVFATA